MYVCMHEIVSACCTSSISGMDDLGSFLTCRRLSSRRPQAQVMLLSRFIYISVCKSFLQRNQLFGLAVTRTMSGASNNDVVIRKKEFRKKIRNAIKELSVEDIHAQSQQVWDRLIDLPVYQAAESVGLFLSMPTGEINTDPILKHAVENGKHVYVPEVGMNFESSQMELMKVIMETPDPTFHKKWPTNRWSIPEPPHDMRKLAAKPGDINLLVVPGLGFDKNCNRLGQGKGYYDQFIARMMANDTPLPLVGVALEPQCVEEDLPVDTYDQQMDMVVLPSRIILSAQTPEIQLPL